MSNAGFYVSTLLDLPTAEVVDRRGIFRQAIAALARASADAGPGPLEGLNPGALLRAVQVALGDGLVEDLDWLAPAAGGVALYALASAIPAGHEQRELGRRVLSRLLTGDAETFVTMAATMAQTPGKALASSGVKARVALAAELPLSAGVPDGPLALALATRREHAREWIALPSTRSLAARRLAARLLERAAREAASRASQGDLHAARVLSSDGLRAPWQRLLQDREPLVWRHVAVARGLLASFQPEGLEALDAAMSPNGNITEWRRAATSVVALVAVRAEEGARLVRAALRRGILEWDPGAAQAFVWGIARAGEVEPDLALELLHEIIRLGTREIGEALSELRLETGASPLLDEARGAFAARFPPVSRRGTVDDGAEALAREVFRDMEGGTHEDAPLREQIAAALDAFAREGAPAAHGAARAALGAARGAVEALEAISRGDEEDASGAIARRTALSVLRDLDVSLLERRVLFDLLHLAPKTESIRAYEEELDGLHERLSGWILAREGPASTGPTSQGALPSAATEVAHPTLRLRRLRALLHLVDGDLGEGGDDPTRPGRLRAAWERTTASLLARAAERPPPLLRRTVLATLARALDALIRGGAWDVADAFLVVVDALESAQDVEVLSEASMDPDLSHVLAAYARFVRDSEPRIVLVPSEGESLPPPRALQRADRVKALDALTQEVAPEASARSEALRTALHRLSSALGAVTRSGSLRGLASSGGSADTIVLVESGVHAVSQMLAGARAKLDPALARPPRPPVRSLSIAVGRVLDGGAERLDEVVMKSGIDELLEGMPVALARLVSGVLWGLAELPKEDAAAAAVPLAEQLPAWLPARRTIGGFYVQRALGVGGSGTVFVVVRSEERHEAAAERFALKVPDFSATAAASLSESEFLQMFRQEASALMNLPAHPNLARFVSFDTASKPKPILVMELVEGSTLEHLLQAGSMDTSRVVDVLVGVVDGLAAMHAVGVGHLDVKPSNVVLRRESDEPVLVDFGLAGRHIRPGCGTGPYGAPEVWGAGPEDHPNPSPQPADVYALACVMFEALTGKVLFVGPNEMAQVSAHLQHDGWPPALAELTKSLKDPEIGELFYHMLRRDPRLRPSIAEVRHKFWRLAPRFTERRWPLGEA